MFDLLPRRTGVLTRQGLSVGDGLHYVFEEKVNEELFTRLPSPPKGNKEAKPLRVSYHPWCVDYVFVLGETADDVIVAELSQNDSTSFLGWTWRDVETYQSASRKFKKADIEDQYQTRFEAKTKMDAIIKRAAERRKLRGPAITKNIPEEKADQQEKDGIANFDKLRKKLPQTKSPTNAPNSPSKRETRWAQHHQKANPNNKQNGNSPSAEAETPSNSTETGRIPPSETPDVPGQPSDRGAA
jgi:hypothetical protein